MNIRILSILGVMAMMVLAWFFYQEDTKIEPTIPTNTDVAYEVTQIKAVQTNETTGEVEYTLTADSLTQNSAGEDEMEKAVLNWQPPMGETYVITANRAKLNQETGDLEVFDGFVLTREATADKPKMVFEGSRLFGNTKTRQLSSDEPLSVKSGQDDFQAKAMRANLNTGEYEFDQIQMLYHAAWRQDQPLF
ncbi:LPS export ABC transporter periplasmic protein LptC [Moraxella sp. Tifton1]|uniref:LPS export ABC transporter periplasmic protein LptC n=1 Tax=Moraxella oculi TaxID=2940516 RepID=A0ABW8U4P3_9GAMM|nr:LPS export ABC transporter periplasmic protein LptC [Moraxella sp. Tifton1]MCL1622679.1 LPS export ABC transporter periplasmic protein LptC [Moraxella sp. Tifton1]